MANKYVPNIEQFDAEMCQFLKTVENFVVRGLLSDWKRNHFVESLGYLMMRNTDFRELIVEGYIDDDELTSDSTNGELLNELGEDLLFTLCDAEGFSDELKYYALAAANQALYVAINVVTQSEDELYEGFLSYYSELQE